jgi:hypothetical protein
VHHRTQAPLIALVDGSNKRGRKKGKEQFKDT